MKITLRIFAVTILLLAVSLLFQETSFGASRGPCSDSKPCEAVDMKKIIVPSDFRLEYRSGLSHGSRGGQRTNIEIDAKGTVRYDTSVRRGGPMDPKSMKERKISRQAVKRIYAQVIGCGFFTMNEHYANTGYSDGIAKYISVQANGKKHSVSTYWCSVKRFSSIEEVVCKETGGCR